MISPKDEQKLVQAAVAAREQAYAPYSKFLVGAAVLADDGTITAGANVENASYGLTLCAERVAACTAVATGTRVLTALAIASRGGAWPCGACRQVLAEFGSKMKVFVFDVDDPTKVQLTTLDQLLPDQFEL